MYPKQHALVSGVAVGAAAVMQGHPLPGVAAWVAVGTVAGVFVDVDHLPLATIFKDKGGVVLSWLRRPHEAVANGRDLKEDLDPDDDLLVHRLVAHLIVLAILANLTAVHPLFVPAALGVAVHIAADIAWDFYQQDGFPYL
ncbi:MAG: hypothetical protein SVW02_04365 [Candidatus Nanohaloarchaea archaeon]|nr:hypothetical protein [Candidatus Nanohaloarchaea archaeon]